MDRKGGLLKGMSDKIGGRTTPIRNIPANFFENNDFGGDRVGFGDGSGAGAVGAAVLTIVEDTVGVPFGGSVDVINVEETNRGARYTVNVNAPTENIAESRAFIDSSTGFLSYFTDEYQVQDVEIENERVLRDTYQYEIELIFEK
jgi:hypothetical protein